MCYRLATVCFATVLMLSLLPCRVCGVLCWCCVMLCCVSCSFDVSYSCLLYLLLLMSGVDVFFFCPVSHVNLLIGVCFGARPVLRYCFMSFSGEDVLFCCLLT